MKKSDIKKGISTILDSISSFRNQLDDILIPVIKIKESLDRIIEIQEEYGIDTGIDFEEVEKNTLLSLVEESQEFEEINNSFDYLISDLECWMEEVSDRKQEQIQEDYIDVLEELRSNIDMSEVCDRDTLEDMLIGIVNDIEESELI